MSKLHHRELVVRRSIGQMSTATTDRYNRSNGVFCRQAHDHPTTQPTCAITRRRRPAAPRAQDHQRTAAPAAPNVSATLRRDDLTLSVRGLKEQPVGAPWPLKSCAGSR